MIDQYGIIYRRPFTRPPPSGIPTGRNKPKGHDAIETSSIPPSAPPQQSSNTGKIILIVVAAIVGLCLIACIAGVLLFGFIGQRISAGVQSDPQEVSETADSIADFDLPGGFQSRSSMHFLGFNFVIYEDTANDSAIILIQMPVQEGMSAATIEQMREQVERQTGQSLSNIRTVDEYEITIRGQPGQVIIQEGTVEDGAAFRQMVVVFQGRGGLAMMSIFGPAASWDQAQYDLMIESIR